MKSITRTINKLEEQKMPSLRTLIVVLLCGVVPYSSPAAEAQQGYSVTYSGGSLPNIKAGEELKLYIDSGSVRIGRKTQDIAVIPVQSISEMSYDQEVHRRNGTAAGLSVVLLRTGAIVPFSKSTKHYIRLTWEEGNNSGGVVLQADKNEYRDLLAALEEVSSNVDRQPGNVQQPVSPIVAARPEPPKAIALRFGSTPANADVKIDGDYWGSTPTAELTRLPAGPHTITIKKVGYLPWARQITLAPGDVRTINAELQAEPNDGTKPHILGLE
jgi:hypothetical protein